MVVVRAGRRLPGPPSCPQPQACSLVRWEHWNARAGRGLLLLFPDFFTSRRRKRRIGGGMSLPEAAVKYTGERGSQSLEPAGSMLTLG